MDKHNKEAYTENVLIYWSKRAEKNDD